MFQSFMQSQIYNLNYKTFPVPDTYYLKFKSAFTASDIIIAISQRRNVPRKLRAEDCATAAKEYIEFK